MFDRFWQADPGRARTGQNAGLGLSIAQRAAQLLHIQLTAERAGDGWLHFTLQRDAPARSAS